MNNEQLEIQEDATVQEAEGEDKTEGDVITPDTETPEEGGTPDAEAPEEGTPDATHDLLGGFLAVLSPKEKRMLIAALARLAESERLSAARARREEELRAIAEMDACPTFAGIATRADAVFALCETVPWLAELPLHERLSAAYFIDRGMRYGEPTKEDLLRAVLSDTELQAALAKQHFEAQKRGAAALPPVSARRGSGRAPATVKASPKTLAEASEEAKKFLRFYK